MKTFTVLFLFISMNVTAQWQAREIYKGLRSDTAVAHDYDGDGQCEVIYSIKDKTVLSSLDGKKQRTLGTYKNIHSLLVDFDNDGDLDYLGASRGQLYWLACPQNPWQDEWKMTSISRELFGTHAVEVADIDKDGFMDVIAGSFLAKGKYPDSLCWFQNPGKNKGWKAHVLADKDAFGGLHYFDFFTKDGKPSIVAGAKGQKFENGNYFATWTAQKDIFKPWQKSYIKKEEVGATHAFARDLNKDGQLEFITANGHGVGINIFTQGKRLAVDSTIEHTHSLDVGDVDGDGDDDIITCAYGSKELAWYENKGNLKFQKHTIATGQEAYDVRLVDLDGDGHKDILVAGRGSNNVIWYKNLKVSP